MTPKARLDVNDRLDLGRILGALQPKPAALPRVTVRRPEDLLVFDLVLDNLVLHGTADGPRISRSVAARPAHLVVEFPPQAFGEESFHEDAQNKEVVPPEPSARIRMAGTSRLSFVMPAGLDDLPATLADVLLAMRSWPLALDGAALPDPDPVRRPRDWFAQLAGTGLLDHATVGLITALEGSGSGHIGPAIEAAGRRIGERALAGIANPVLAQQALQAEIDDLVRHHPVLRDGPAHQAGLAALSLAGLQGLARLTSANPSVSPPISEIVSGWPYLPMLLLPHEPGPSSTALELPYRLVLSPIESARFSHAVDPATHADRTELWHSRIRTTIDDIGPDSGANLRALWSPDYELEPAERVALTNAKTPYRMSLTPQDRAELVTLMASWSEPGVGGTRYVPRAARARRLHLSALGALIDIDGNWEPPVGMSLAAWRHLAGLGRDAYVRLVRLGFLEPFRHAAAVIDVTERKFEWRGPGATDRIAVLRHRTFIVVRQPVVTYDPAEHAHSGHNFPFTQVEILTKVTPDLSAPGIGASALATTPDFYSTNSATFESAFWPVVGTADVPFSVLATDIAGHTVSFSMPMLFVDRDTNYKHPTPVRAAYNADGPSNRTKQRRTANLGNQTITYAAPAPGGSGDPSLPTASLRFHAGELTGAVREIEANEYPEIEAATVGIKAVQKLLGQPGAVVDVTYPQTYVDDGFGATNPGEVFLQTLNDAHDLDFGGGNGQAKSDALGALAAPQMSILGLSRVMGPVAGQKPANLADPSQIQNAIKGVINNQFDPTSFFNDATILGGVPLASLFQGIKNSLLGDDVPKLVSQDFPDRVEARFDWTTTLDRPDPLNLVIPGADPSQPSTLHMQGVVTTAIGGAGGSSYQAEATLTNFKVNLFGFIILWFDELSFDARAGQKPDVAVGLHPTDAVMFGGPLEFVNTLREYIPSNGFTDPPALTVTPSGIAASYSLNLPALTVGIFSLTNASLGAGFQLPFDNSPATVHFNFAERQHPFCITVSLLGGGGFFAIGVSSHGVQEIEAALEFGAELAIDLGVASGSVEIKAGVYFHWLEKPSGGSLVQLSGYVRLHGELSVLGLISASLTFNLQLSYQNDNGKSLVWGEATLTVEVDVLFVSFDVSVSCRKEFAGSDADPKFLDLIPDEPTWALYCDAFAEEVA